MLPPAEPESAPDAEMLLRSIAAAAPALWFPLRHAHAHGLPREALTEPVWLLRQTGLVEVGDWVKGLGQGLRLSAHGEKAVATPTPLALRPPDAAPPTRGDVPTELMRGDEARTAVLDPPPAVVAPSLLYANIAWFAVGCIVAWRGGVGMEFLKGDGHPGAMDALQRTGAVTAAAVWNGDWWRLATACFVHIGLFHLLCNMLMLGMMGPFAEGLWGKRRFALIYAVSGVVGSVAAVALHPVSAKSGADVLMAGASGALWGMLTGVVVWVVHNRRHLPPELTRDRLQRLGFMLLLNVAVSFVPGISAEAHFGGGAAGALVAWSVATGHRRPKLYAVGGVVLVLGLSLLMLVAAVKWSDGWRTLKQREQVRQLLVEALRTGEKQAAVRAAVGDDWAKLSPNAMGQFRSQFAAILPARIANETPGPASLRKSVAELHTAATGAVGRLPADGEVAGRYREYLAAVVGYATALRDELDRPGRKDTPELDAAWRAYASALMRLGRWE